MLFLRKYNTQVGLNGVKALPALHSPKAVLRSRSFPRSMRGAAASTPYCYARSRHLRDECTRGFRSCPRSWCWRQLRLYPASWEKYPLEISNCNEYIIIRKKRCINVWKVNELSCTPLIPVYPYTEDFCVNRRIYLLYTAVMLSVFSFKIRIT